jgi:hypothetical protein
MTEPDDLLPYDNKERRFRHDDADNAKRARGLGLVARLLGLAAPPPAEGLRYDMRFFSGGIGVIEQIHIAFPCAPAEVDAIVARLRFVTPEAALADKAMRDDFEYVVIREEEPRPLGEAVAAFIEENRTEIQPRPDARARAWFSQETGPNAYSLVYEQDGELAFIAYNQG